MRNIFIKNILFLKPVENIKDIIILSFLLVLTWSIFSEILKYNQIPNIYGIIGISMIIVGVILLNTLAKAN